MAEIRLVIWMPPTTFADFARVHPIGLPASIVAIAPSRYLTMMRDVRSAGFVNGALTADGRGVAPPVDPGVGVDASGVTPGVAPGVAAEEASGEATGVAVCDDVVVVGSSDAASAGIEFAINATAEIAATTASLGSEINMFSSDPFVSNVTDFSDAQFSGLPENVQVLYKMSCFDACQTPIDRLARMPNNDLLVWIDCEMTGLDVNVDELVEIAVIVTDSQLVPLHAGLQLVIKPHDSALANMGDFVREMHTSSGLITEIEHGISVEEAQATVLDYLDGLVPEGVKPPLAGNSVGTDRAFLVRYMPVLEGRLHYRTIDVSTIKELARRWQPRVYFNAPPKRNGHRALDDIRESIRELDYYRASVFDASGDITTEQAQQASAAMGEKYADLV